MQGWYRGQVTDITQLRPGTVIKDDAIAELLRGIRGATFVTINVADFWRRIAPARRFTVACFALSHDRADEISKWLRRLFALPQFRTRKARCGKVARVSQRQVQFYTSTSWAIQVVNWDAK